MPQFLTSELESTHRPLQRRPLQLPPVAVAGAPARPPAVSEPPAPIAPPLASGREPPLLAPPPLLPPTSHSRPHSLSGVRPQLLARSARSSAESTTISARVKGRAVFSGSNLRMRSLAPREAKLHTAVEGVPRAGARSQYRSAKSPEPRKCSNEPPSRCLRPARSKKTPPPRSTYPMLRTPRGRRAAGPVASKA